MSSSEYVKDDFMEVSLELLQKSYEYFKQEIRKGKENLTEKNTDDPYKEFKKMMKYVEENSDKEGVKELAKSFAEDPETGSGIFRVMNDKVQLFGLKEAKEEGDRYLKALNVVQEKNLKSDKPNDVLDKEIDKLKGIEVGKMLNINNAIEKFEKKNYSVLNVVGDERIKEFVNIANDFEGVRKDERKREKIMNTYQSIVDTFKLKKEKENERDQEVKDENELDRSKEKKKERTKEVDMER